MMPMKNASEKCLIRANVKCRIRSPTDVCTVEAMTYIHLAQIHRSDLPQSCTKLHNANIQYHKVLKLDLHSHNMIVLII